MMADRLVQVLAVGTLARVGFRLLVIPVGSVEPAVETVGS
jgi:hypothetical protein